MDRSPEMWHTFISYREANDFVRSVKLVNDAAERGVELRSDCAAILTDNKQRESVLQAVEEHR